MLFRSIVTTGSGYVQLINAGDGNNIITLGASTTNGTGFVRTGNGNDLVRLNVMNPAFGVILQGGGGINTADFSQFTAGVTVSLNRFDYQSVGDLTGADNPALGYFSIVQYQNLSGTGLADTLEGGTASNQLSGGFGADTLRGLAGNDTLIGGGGNDSLNGGLNADVLRGGAGNDSLTGGTGADLFEFNPGEGADRIADFVKGADLIDFIGTAQLSDITFAAVATGVRMTVGTTSVIAEGQTLVLMQDAANFLF